MVDGALDFFISRAGVDKAFAVALGNVLESGRLGRPYSVLLQDWDFMGNNFLARMDDGIRRCKRMIVILSKEYLASAYTQVEWQAVLHSDIYNFENRIVLLKVDDCTPTGILSLYAYTDLSSVIGTANDQTLEDMVRAAIDSEFRKSISATKRISDALIGRRRKLVDDTLKTALSVAPIVPIAPAVETLWSPPGDSGELRRLLVLEGPQGGAPVRAAREYAARAETGSRYGACWRLDASSEVELCRDLQRLGSLVLPELSAVENVADAARTTLRLVERWQHGRLLLLFEDARDRRLLEAWLPRTGADIIASSSVRGLVPATVQRIEVQRLERRQAAEWLIAESGRADLSFEAAASFVDHVDRHPTALDFAARMLSEDALLGPGEIVRAYGANENDDLAALRVMTENLVKQARVPRADAERVVGILSWFGGREIALKDLQRGWTDPAAKSATSELVRLRLVDLDRTDLSLLSLDGAVRVLGPQALDPSGATRPNVRTAIADLQAKVASSAEPRLLTLITRYAINAAQAQILADDWDILDAAASALHLQGMHVQAAELLQAMADFALSDEPADCTTAAAVLASEASVWSAAGEAERALGAISKARWAGAGLLDAEALSHLDLVEGSAYLARNAGPADLDRAEACLKQALTNLTQRPEQDPDTVLAIGAALQNLGGCAHQRKLPDEALALQKQALDANEHAVGRSELPYADAAMAVANTLCDMGRRQEAQEFQGAALSVYLTRLHPDHRKVALALELGRKLAS